MIFNMSPNRQNAERLQSARKLNSNSLKKSSTPNKQRGERTKFNERSKELKKHRTILMSGNKLESQHGRTTDTCLTKASQARGDVDLFDVVDE